MIAIIGHIEVDPAHRDRLVAATADLQRKTRQEEPGCLDYTISADPLEPGRIHITELWQSTEALEEHFRHPNFVATGAVLRSEPRLGGTAMKYRIDAAGPVRGADGNATASFDDAPAP